MNQRSQKGGRSSHGTASPLLKFAGLYRAVALLVLGMAVPISALAQQNASSHHTVEIRQMQFVPARITVSVGDVVEWKNDDIFAHTVTAGDGSFDSGLIDPGKSWQTTITHPGSIAYHCRPHPNMRAELVVRTSPEATQEKNPGAARNPLLWTPPRRPQEFHPILVNFTAALLPLAFLCDLLGLAFRRQSLHHAAYWMVVSDAAITPFTALAGWWWKSTSAAALPARLITVHEWLGTIAAAIFIALAIWRWNIHQKEQAPSVSYMAFALVAVLALVYQGSLGGAMVFGR